MGGWDAPGSPGEHPHFSPWAQEPGEGKGGQGREEAGFSVLSEATSVGGLLALNLQGLPNAFSSCLRGPEGRDGRNPGLGFPGPVGRFQASGPWSAYDLHPGFGGTSADPAGLRHLPRGGRKQTQAAQCRIDVCTRGDL